MPFLNSFPIYFPIESGKVDFPKEIRFVEGPPSYLCDMMKKGELDLSVVSSIEYGLNSKDWLILDSLCIGSKGPVGSVILFSRVPFESIRKVYITPKSRTSVELLKCIFRKRGMGVSMLPLTGDPAPLDDAVLLIGDDALREKKKDRFPYTYDLSSMWIEEEELPFVFALWCVRKDVLVKDFEAVRGVTLSFVKARSFSLKNIGLLSKMWSDRNRTMSHSEVENYIKGITYSLDGTLLKGLHRFFELSLQTRVSFSFVLA